MLVGWEALELCILWKWKKLCNHYVEECHRTNHWFKEFKELKKKRRKTERNKLENSKRLRDYYHPLFSGAEQMLLKGIKKIV